MPVVNLDGVKPGELVLDGATLAEHLPRQDHEMGRSGDRQAESRREAAVAGDRRRPSLGRLGHDLQLHQLSLEGVSKDWKTKVGASTAVEWPTGLGAKGNEGVANNVAQTKGAIGYVEYAYAMQNKMTSVDMINKDGKTVAAESASFQAAAANADWAHSDSFYLILTDQPGATTWPITAATFILMYKQPSDAAASDGSAEVLRLGLRQGRQGGRGARLRSAARHGRRR